ncbi:MAG TPA: BCCT family transporter [Anaerovoracaceae bacterium]|nr:BCCT family transporter [Anaerovoracaceae bacterium]
MEKIKNKGKIINHAVFWPSFLIPVALVVVSFINNEKFTSLMMNTYVNLTNSFGWVFMIIGTISVVVCGALMIGPLGNVKFGGEDAKPKYTFLQWFTMSLCGGIAIGIVFWGVAEPISYLAQPPLGLESFSKSAAVFSVSQTYFHWSFTPYSFYAICTIPIALAVYNKNRKFSISSGLYFLIGEKCEGLLGKIVDSVALLALIGGISTSLGLGIMQISSGISFVAGIDTSTTMWTIVTVITVASFTFTSVIGIDKGLKWLANQNFKLYVGVLIFILLVGPFSFIMNLGVESFGEFISSFFNKSTYLGIEYSEDWAQWWTIFYWAVWIAYGPVVGVFLTRLTYGRTIRQFLLTNVVAPGIFCIVWFMIIGGAAIDMQLSGIFDLWGSYQTSGLESSVFSFFSQFPLGIPLVVVFLVIIIVSFITMADSMTSVAAIMSTRGFRYEQGEPPMFLKIIWGTIMGVLAWVMIAAAGIDGTKMIGVIASFPLLIVFTAFIISSVKGAFDIKNEDSIIKEKQKQEVV